MFLDDQAQEEREYHKYLTLSQNEKLPHYIEPHYQLYYLLYMYCLAKSTFSDFPYSSIIKIPIEYEIPKQFQILYNDIKNEKNKIFMKVQIYNVMELIIPKFSLDSKTPE